MNYITGNKKIIFSKDLTYELQYKSNNAYGTKINELLLVAVGLAVKRTTKQSCIHVSVESYGRQAIDGHVQVDRTVGWFTSTYPVKLDISYEEIGKNIISVKEILRQVPNEGIGYGVLQLGDKHQFLKDKPDIGFNYFGTIENTIIQSNSGMRYSGLDTGLSIADENGAVTNDILFNGMIVKDQLEFDIYYNKKKFDDDFIEKIKGNFDYAVKSIIKHCTEQTKRIVTQSDYQIYDLNYEEFYSILQKYGEDNIEKIYDLSSMQEGMLYHKLKDHNSTSYHIQIDWRLTGEVEVDKLKQAIQFLSRQFEVFRIAIVYSRISNAKQVVLKDRNIEVAEYNLIKLNKNEQENEIEIIKLRDLKRGFDLQNDSLIRMYLIQEDKANIRIIWSFHHIILDGWCLNIVKNKLIDNYNCLISQKSDLNIIKNSNIKFHYDQYITWLRKQNNEKSVEFFLDFLKGYDGIVRLPSIKDNTEKNRLIEELSIQETDDFLYGLQEFSKKHSITANTIVETAIGIVLQKYNHTNDVVFGKVVSGRNIDLDGIENGVGLFVNTIPTRILSKKNMTVIELLKTIQKNSIDCIRYEHCSLAEIQNGMPQKEKLINILYVFENYHFENNGEKDLQLVSYHEEVNYDVLITSGYINNKLYYKVSYNSAIYSKKEIKLFLDRLRNVIHRMLLESNTFLSEIDVIDNREEIELQKMSLVSKEYNLNKSLVELLEDRVTMAPGATAIVCNEKSITYRELNDKANQLANQLLSLGVKRNEFVGILINRSIEMVISLVAILKAGAAYVPIDTEYPVKRKEYIINDSGIKVLITNQEEILNIDIPNKIKKIYTEYIDGNADKLNGITGSYDMNDAMYMIYTSGSTGKPKGVIVENRTLLNLLAWENEELNIRSQDHVLWATSISFDVATQEILSTLISGATGFLISSDQKRDRYRMLEYVEENSINIVFTTPSYFSALTSDQESTNIICKNLTKVILAGEKFYLNDNVKACALAKDIVFYNNYGPTETHVVTSKVYNIEDNISNSIGKPISNAYICIVNEERLCGVGMIGEICVSGIPVARGYLNQSLMNKEKFRDNPFGHGKLYYTGDLGKWLENGEIEYWGRKDDQLKISGFRVELGEIENEIRKSNNKITDVAVIAKGEDDKKICAYIVSNEMINLSELKSDLIDKLPDYMIPLMLQVENIPLTSNGKVDKNKLPELLAENVYQKIMPRTELEKRLCDIFSNILGINEIGINDNFFEYGGHSLKVMNLINSIEKDFGIRMPFNSIFKFPTVEKIAKNIEKGEKQKYKAFNKAEEKKYYSMTSAQKRMFFINKFDKDSLTYNMPIIYRVKKDSLDISRVKNVFEKLIMRHEILRTKFCVVNGEPVQQILENVKADIQEVTCEKFEMRKYIVPFDLETPPLFRVKIIKSNTDNEDLLLIDMHHIISDGRSCEILFEEFNTLYEGGTLNKIALQYKDYSEQINRKSMLKEEAYWTKQLNKNLPRLDLPLDFIRPKIQSNKGSVVSASISDELQQRIEKLAFLKGTTEYMILISAVMILLHRYSRQDEILIGTPVSGRTHKDTENILGLFVNTIVLKANFYANEQYGKFIERFSKNALEAFDNQEYPFDKIVEFCETERDLSRNPIFDVMFSYRETEDEFANLEENTVDITHFDLSIAITKTPHGYILGGEYCTSLFKKDSIVRMLQRLIKILDIISYNPKVEVDKIDILSSEEKNTILKEFNNTDIPYPQEKTIPQLFEEVVDENAHKKAIIYKDQSLTYSEMNNKAQYLANFLAAKGVKPGDCIALAAERKIESIVAMLSILKIGATYVPIEPNYPKKRIDYILSDSKCVGILWVKEDLEVSMPIWKENLYDLDIYKGYKNISYTVTPQDIAYIIYTSGTTGIPKGVMITQKNIVKLVKNVSYFDFNQIKLLQTCELVFDVSTFEIWGTLLNGGCLNLIDKEDLFHANLVKNIIEKNKIDTAFFSVALFNQLLQEDISVFDSLKSVWSGGEALSVEHINLLRRHNSQIHIYNGYGPTENTTFTTSYEIRTETDIIPIGQPLSNTKVYILDKNNMLCGIGIPGEICTTGDGLGDGYLNKRELTKEKFIENPFGQGKMYKTGDLGRWTPDGNVEFLGRIDQQVKIRGFRIELGEIENTIRKVEDVKDATVIVKGEKDNKKLCAYFTSDKILDLEIIRNRLLENLPEYMIPLMMQIEKIPMNTSGKVDKNILPDISNIRKVEFISPRNEEEKVIARVFKEVLKLEKVGAMDNFFELGGDSIKAISIAGKLKDCGYNIEIKKILMLKTVEELADYIRKNKVEKLDMDRENINYTKKDNQEEKNKWYYCLRSAEFDKDTVDYVLKKLLINYKPIFGELITYNVHTQMIAGKDKELVNYVENIIAEINNSACVVDITIINNYYDQYVLFAVKNSKMDSYSFARFIKDFVDAYIQYQLNEKIVFDIISFESWDNIVRKKNTINIRKSDYWNKICDSLLEEKNHLQYETESSQKLESSKVEIRELDQILEYSKENFGESIDAMLLAAISLALYEEGTTVSVPMIIEKCSRKYLNLDKIFTEGIGNLSIDIPVVLEIKENLEEYLEQIKLQLLTASEHIVEYVGQNRTIKSSEISSRIPVYRCINEHDLELNQILGKEKLIQGMSVPLFAENIEYDHEVNFLPQVLDNKLVLKVMYLSGSKKKEDIDRILERIHKNVHSIVDTLKSKKVNQIRNIKSMLLSGSKMYNSNLKGEEKEVDYIPTNLQNYFLKENNFVVINVQLGKMYELKYIQEALNMIIKKHSVLRTGVNGEYLTEYSKKTEWSIPVLSLQNVISNTLIFDLMNEILKNNKYSKDKLINNLYIIEREGEYEIFGYIQHAIWDSMSSVNFEELLFALLRDRSRTIKLDTYSNHIKGIRNVARYPMILNAEEKNMIRRLKEFIRKYDENLPIEFTYVRLNLSEKEKEKIKENPISFSYRLLAECLKDNSIDIPNNFPVSVLFHGRNTENEKKLGLYLVLLPLNTQGSLEEYYRSVRKNDDIYHANYFSELLFEYLEGKIIIPPYINFKNIFELEDNKQDSINLPRINVHSSTRLDGTIGIEIMILRYNVHILFPAYNKNIRKIENSIEQAFDDVINK